MTLWLSSTIHDGKSPVAPRKKKGQPLIERIVLYITFRPTEESERGKPLTGKDISNLDECRDHNRMANHWGTKMFAKTGRYKSKNDIMQELLKHPEEIPSWCGKEYYRNLSAHGQKIYGVMDFDEPEE
eukprot:TRINITY_DN4611_c0_g1_i2.p1 TRINITY_DN4611_c0_g1~~TRINITY_DN4611_c0_g1_i2.p1  ORF type:complete len:128 (-),score=36.61 TRINITY_DN4611_c0_g1_i2:7-390(-)